MNTSQFKSDVNRNDYYTNSLLC